ncbi:zinc finger CCHC domain-containing protein 12-like [Simochromis diagramma]|uniref:zinc finger CCHC domain-containing protein 12-like n=1 Tax=Simochromis diagramma TaxID=43689 RepID=UPI001A7E542F|nr:zinc finger CCHC domain-containing protein 12-like [Simochromis diagramma]XP_039862254.1 zinc finger CCHC domain-containing protein 12-like [Simochromis diagramma]XP_039862255.1 zinc finger CCHC domain-containing protein 12-like [Simochromis diagramma]
MDVVLKEAIKIPNAVIIKGLTNSDLDEEVAIYLGKHGSVNRHIRIDDPQSEFHRQMIAEFNHASAMDTLNPLLPQTIQSSAQPEVTFEIRSLTEAYAANARNVTRAYMRQLSEMANLSGHSLENMLKEGLANLNVPPLSPQPTVSTPVDRGETSLHAQGDHSPSQPAADFSQSTDSIPILNQNLIDLDSPTQFHPTLELNPPNVRRVVVEHVVRSSEVSSHSPMPSRIRAFSGRIPRPNSEADYDAWRTSVEVLMSDPAVSDLNCTQRILDSLLSPATDVTKHLGPNARPSEYLRVLDSAFGAVEDSDELYARFMNTLQNEGERPSAYLQRLHVCLTKAMRRGGVNVSDFDKQLLKQFLRGCWEDSLIGDLQLGQRKESPPSFSELLLLLRTEEDKQASKVRRMRQHLGQSKPSPSNPKHRAMSNVQTASSCESNLNVLKKQIADLSAQLNSWKIESQKQNQPKHSKSECHTVNAKVEVYPTKRKASTTQNFAKANAKPRPWYCFHCGEDGHIASSCENEPNPSLVATKRKQLRERQSSWEASTRASDEPPLN